MILLSFGTSIASLWFPLSRAIALYLYYKNTVLRLVWYCLVFIQYSYYCDLFCLGSESRLCSRKFHMWVRYNDNTKITVVCMSLLLLFIDLRLICYFIVFYFKLTNGAMVKWWMVKWCNGEIQNSTGHFSSCKYWICSFVLFSDTAFSHQKKQFIIFNIW